MSKSKICGADEVNVFVVCVCVVGRGCMYVCVDVWMDVWMDGHRCVCVFIDTHFIDDLFLQWRLELLSLTVKSRAVLKQH